MPRLLLVLLFFPVALYAQVTGKVIRIASGDCFTLLTPQGKKVNVRLYGIDCPELDQPYGRQARNFTHAIMFSKIVTVAQKGKGRKGEVLGIAKLPGRNINEYLLKKGLAWCDTSTVKESGWMQLERTARKSRRGLWANDDAVAPWEWRNRSLQPEIIKCY